MARVRLSIDIEPELKHQIAVLSALRRYADADKRAREDSAWAEYAADDPLLSTKAKKRLEELEEKQTGIEVVVECVYVLAIKLYGTSSIDFVDAYLVSLHRLTGMEILSFDKKVRQLTR